jgi:hypothetical protein
MNACQQLLSRFNSFGSAFDRGLRTLTRCFFLLTAAAPERGHVRLVPFIPSSLQLLRFLRLRLD